MLLNREQDTASRARGGWPDVNRFAGPVPVIGLCGFMVNFFFFTISLMVVMIFIFICEFLVLKCDIWFIAQ